MNVIETVIVAALGNGNDIVVVIDAVDARGALSFANVEQVALTASSIPRLLSRFAPPSTVSITTTVSFPFPSAATITVSITFTTDRSRPSAASAR